MHARDVRHLSPMNEFAQKFKRYHLFEILSY